MATITPNTPTPTAAIYNNDIAKELEPIEILLAKAGHKILRNELHSPWMSLTEVTRVCQKYKLKSPVPTHKARELEPLVMNYFAGRDAMKLDGVKVNYKTERNERYREEVWLCFHRHDLANDGPIRKLADERSSA